MAATTDDDNNNDPPALAATEADETAAAADTQDNQKKNDATITTTDNNTTSTATTATNRTFQKLGQGMAQMGQGVKTSFETVGKNTKKVFVREPEKDGNGASSSRPSAVSEQKSERTLKQKIQQVFTKGGGSDAAATNKEEDDDTSSRPPTQEVVAAGTTATAADGRPDVGERQMSDLTSPTMYTERTARVNNRTATTTTTTTETGGTTTPATSGELTVGTTTTTTTTTTAVANAYATASLQRQHSDWLLFHIWWVSLAVAAVPTVRHTNEIWNHFVVLTQDNSAAVYPNHTLLVSWLFCAYWTGQVWSLERLVELAHQVYCWVVAQRRGGGKAAPMGDGSSVGSDRRASILERSLEYVAEQILYEPLPEGETAVSEGGTPRERKWKKWARGVRGVFDRPGNKGKRQQLQKNNKKEPPPPRYYSASQVAYQRRRSVAVLRKTGAAIRDKTVRDKTVAGMMDSMTNLASEETGERRPSWIDRMDPMRHPSFQNHDDWLMQVLMKNPRLRRRRGDLSQTEGRREDANHKERLTDGGGPDGGAAAAPLLSVVPEGQEVESSSDGMMTDDTVRTGTTSAVGTQQSGNVESFHDMDEYIIHPVLKVRGMDIFLTDNPEFDIVNNPWFEKNGLRDVPGLIFNGVTQWGNILVYFELPSWVTDLGDSLTLRDGDSPDKRALKKFLTGSDEYKNDRLKLIPSLVDGPMAVKVLAPPKKERMLHGTQVPLSWYNHDRKENPATGEILHPVVLCTLDCVSGKVIRSMAGIVKKYLVKLTIDLALVIGEPQDPSKRLEHEEPQACLGLFRFENVDVMSCPSFPIFDDDEFLLSEEERDEQLAMRISKMSVSMEEAHDIAVARRVSGISKEDFEKLQMEELEDSENRDNSTNVVEQ